MLFSGKFSILCRHLLLVPVVAFSIELFPHTITASAEVSSISRRLTKQVENYLKGIKFITANFEQASSSGEVYAGKFWLSKKNGVKVKINYDKSLNQEILIKNRVITVLDKKTSKQYNNSISQTPIYSILTGTLNLCKENFEVEENSKDFLRLRVNRSNSFGGMSVMLAFSKYPNGNLKHLEAWVIDDGKNETLFSFDPNTLRVNDPKSVCDEIFTLSSSKDQ